MADVKDRGKKCIAIKGKKLALFNVGGKIYCIDNSCTHAEGPLCEGNLDGSTIECPWHGSKFDITTGKVLEAPATEPVKTYQTKIENGEVFVKV